MLGLFHPDEIAAASAAVVFFGVADGGAHLLALVFLTAALAADNVPCRLLQFLRYPVFIRRVGRADTVAVCPVQHGGVGFPPGTVVHTVRAGVQQLVMNGRFQSVQAGALVEHEGGNIDEIPVALLLALSEALFGARVHAEFGVLGKGDVQPPLFCHTDRGVGFQIAHIRLLSDIG